MKNYFLKGIVALILSAVCVVGFAGLVSADSNSSFWAKQANGELYTNSGSGLGQAIINVAGCNGCGSGGLSSVLTDGITIFGDGLNNPLSALFSSENKIISGGVAWSGTGYVYDVSSIYYYFDGFNTAGPDQVTMAVADPTNNRFDAVVVNESGTISVITGTASANPAFPTIPETQLVIGYVLVEAGTTSPTVLQDLIYDENTGTPTEWTTSTYTTGVGSTGTVDFNGNTSCYHSTKCIDLVTNQRLGARFVRGTAIDLQTFAYVQVWYRNNGTALASTKTPSVRFEDSLGTPIGNTVNLTTYGISRSVVGTWQVAVIPVSAFGSVTNVKGLRAIMTGGTLSSQANWSLDFMLTSGGILPQGSLGPIYLSPSGTLYSNGAATGATAVADSIFFGTNAGFQATNAVSSIFLGKNAGYQAVASDHSNFIGEEAGYNATQAQKSNFIGYRAGFQATNAQTANFFGYESGKDATDATHSNFSGYQSGYGATNAAFSNFFGSSAGKNAINANNSQFFGYQAGQGATNAANTIAIGYNSALGASSADSSQFIGSESGSNATNAASSVFLGYQTGQGATNAANSIFIGYQSGLNDTVDNTSSGTSILIGDSTNTGGFKNSIGLGQGATNTAVNQLMIGSATTPINQAVIYGTGGIQVPVGTSGERIATQGMIRYNTTTSKFEGYNGSTWVDLN